MIITVSGPAGSGKTTLASLLSGKLGCSLISTGSIFRRIASDRGMSVVELNIAAEEDEGIDRELDRRVVAEAISLPCCVVEGRLSCHMMRLSNVSAFSVYLDAPAETRIERISRRDGIDRQKAAQETFRREESERRRYLKIYGIDISDLSCYSMVINSADLPPESIAEMVMARVRKG
ncbi:MAG: cytidylate kinase family protein [Thermoplasmata archaeon]|uniref:Cytidylate kinase n=1 Tax=Candidatus Sysuiplasma superficiale TaxID=2823368 RepID=A0A8J7YTB0_9ARCH|nr:cytidylate kinase family protein [Candidatus Sysuiplasma superficiale]MBX8644204.1 cytidylate kinase family protein [Candidatus Sysuiplasma superficiale]MCL4347239.1 cytidylate kinase family protein [Candidatus Thermoplasmatota archaeon]